MCRRKFQSLHEVLCKDFSAFIATRPSATDKLAILFPEDSKKPKLIWVKTNDSHPYAHLQKHLRSGTSRYKQRSTVLDGTSALDHTITICFLSKHSSKENESIIYVTEGKQYREWSGPVIILSEPGTNQAHRHFQDITMGDFKAVVDFFLAHGERADKDATIILDRRNNGGFDPSLINETISSTYVVCNAMNATPCSGCISSLYCSAKCKDEDWPIHRFICKDFASFPISNPRSGKNHKLALLFPTQTSDLKILWLEFKNHGDWQEPLVDRYLGGDGCRVERNEITRNIDFPLTHTVIVNSRDDFLSDGSLNNNAIATATAGRSKYEWKGPVIIYSHPTTRRDVEVYQDITSADFRYAVNWLKGLSGEVWSPSMELLPDGRMWIKF